MLRSLLICSLFSAALHVGVFAAIGNRASRAVRIEVRGPETSQVTVRFVDAMPSLDQPDLAEPKPTLSNDDALMARIDPPEILRPLADIVAELAEVEEEPVVEKRFAEPVEPIVETAIPLTAHAVAHETAWRATSDQTAGLDRIAEPVLARSVVDMASIDGDVLVERSLVCPILPILIDSWITGHLAALVASPDQVSGRDKGSATELIESPGIESPGENRILAGVRDGNPQPRYPRSARRRGLEGLVELDVEVLTTGRAGRVSVRRSSGHAVLDEAAMRGVRQWRFVPGRIGHRAVVDRLLVPIEFRLGE